MKINLTTRIHSMNLKNDYKIYIYKNDDWIDKASPSFPLFLPLSQIFFENFPQNEIKYKISHKKNKIINQN